MPGDTPMPFDPEYDVPLFYCHVCARELRRPWCRKCGTEDNTASNWIPNGKKQRPAAPLAFDASLDALDVEEVSDGYNHVRYPTILGLDAVRAAHRAEVDALRDKLTRVLGAIQRLQPNGSPIPGDEAVVAEWIVGEVVSARATHRAEVERAVAEEREAIAAWHDAEADRIRQEIATSLQIMRENASAFVGLNTSMDHEYAQAETHRECAAAIRARGVKS